MKLSTGQIFSKFSGGLWRWFLGMFSYCFFFLSFSSLHVLLQCMKVKSESEVTQWSRVQLLATPGLQPFRLLCPWDSPGNSTGVGCHCLLRFPSLQDSVLKIFSPGYCFGWRKGDPFQGLRVGSCLTLGNELSEERSAIQVRAFIGKGCWGGGQEGEVNGENCSATWLTVSDFIVIGLVSGLASHSELGSFLGAHASFSWDGFQWGGSWEVGRTSELESPISFWPLQNSGWWELVSSLFVRWLQQVFSFLCCLARLGGQWFI